MLVMFLIYALIPIIIVLNIFFTDNKKARRCRFVYAIPAIILNIINISFFVYHNFYKKITIFKESRFFFLVPPLLLLLVIIFYHSGKKEERIIKTEIMSLEIDKIKDTRGFNKNYNLVLSYPDDDEKL